MHDMTELEKIFYKKDFDQNITDSEKTWVVVKFKNLDIYHNNTKMTGRILFDGKFIINGVIFEKNEFKIIDKHPFKQHPIKWWMDRHIWNILNLRLWLWIAPTLYFKLIIIPYLKERLNYVRKRYRRN
jgi:hypothetical protein